VHIFWELMLKEYHIVINIFITIEGRCDKNIENFFYLSVINLTWCVIRHDLMSCR